AASRTACPCCSLERYPRRCSTSSRAVCSWLPCWWTWSRGRAPGRGVCPLSDRVVVNDADTPEVAQSEIPPELIATSLGQYLRARWVRVRSGDSGVLPVVLAIVAVA